jgi:hypothetical protein
LSVHAFSFPAMASVQDHIVQPIKRCPHTTFSEDCDTNPAKRRPKMTFLEDHFTKLMLKYTYTTINRYESEVRERIAQFVSNYHRHMIIKQDYAAVFEMCFFMAHLNNDSTGWDAV